MSLQSLVRRIVFAFGIAHVCLLTGFRLVCIIFRTIYAIIRKLLKMMWRASSNVVI